PGRSFRCSTTTATRTTSARAGPRKAPTVRTCSGRWMTTAAPTSAPPPSSTASTAAGGRCDHRPCVAVPVGPPPNQWLTHRVTLAPQRHPDPGGVFPLSDKEFTMKPTRLWWPLREVLPLAEHAMAASGHQLTGAQVAAKAPTQPALIWTSTPADGSALGGDWLSSNGTPGWYDEEGATHHAAARTWRHRVTGVSGSPGQPDTAMGFLPLTSYSLAKG